jgi:DNA-binding LytR/AlgR family response regulator
MNCILIEDDSFQRHLISQYIDQTEGLHLVAEFETATKSIPYLAQHPVDLIFLDIELPEMNGVEFLEQFKPTAKIIFISSASKYAVDGFNLEVSDYLLKPISFARFSRSVSKILDYHRENDSNTEVSPSDFLFVKDKGIYHKILFRDIQYIQSSSEYVMIHTKEKRILLYSSMDGILKKLPTNFMRVHRSFIVNLACIDRVNGNTLEVNNQSISISKTYQFDVMNQLGLKVK